MSLRIPQRRDKAIGEFDIYSPDCFIRQLADFALILVYCELKC
jgi:hypothetical protein